MKNFELKEDLNIEDLLFLQPAALFLLGVVTTYFYEHNIPLVITSLREDVAERTTNSHREGRAFDLRSRNLTEDQRLKFQDFLEKEYNDIGAYSLSDGVQRVYYYHRTDEGAYHFHIQVAPHKVIKDALKRHTNL